MKILIIIIAILAVCGGIAWVLTSLFSSSKNYSGRIEEAKKEINRRRKRNSVKTSFRKKIDEYLKKE